MVNAMRKEERVLVSVEEGYIVANSKFNYVNYEDGLLSIHLRLAEPHDHTYEYYYDYIAILTFTGRIVGGFWLHDLAVFICKGIMGHWKNWQFFVTYFKLMHRVYLTKRRLYMFFPTTVPVGLNIVNIWNMYFVDDEYLPGWKIPGSVIAYNFSSDSTFDELARERAISQLNTFLNSIQSISPKHDENGDFHYPYPFNEENLPGPPPQIGEPYLSKLKGRNKEIWLKGFEPVAVVPKNLLDSIRIQQNTIENLVESNLAWTGMMAMISASSGIPLFFGTPMGAVFVGFDTSLVALDFDPVYVDNQLDKFRDMIIGGEELAGMASGLETMYFNLYTIRDFGYTYPILRDYIKLYWRKGPPIYYWLYSDPWLGPIIVPIIQYDQTIIHFLNRPFYKGDWDLWYGMYIYARPFVKNGREYLYIANTHDGTWDVLEIDTGRINKGDIYTEYPDAFLRLLYGGTFREGHNVIVYGYSAEHDRYVYMDTDARSPIVLLPRGDDIMKPVFMWGAGAMVYLYKNGSYLKEEPQFVWYWKGKIPPAKKTDAKNRPTFTKLKFTDPQLFVFKVPLKVYVKKLLPAYYGFFVYGGSEHSDSRDRWYFVTHMGVVYVPQGVTSGEWRIPFLTTDVSFKDFVHNHNSVIKSKAEVEYYSYRLLDVLQPLYGEHY